MKTLIVPRRFRGPTDSANGGYICGRVAALAPHPVTVRLMQPPPLETPLEVAEGDGLLEVRHAGETIAQARPAGEEAPVPPPPPSAEDAGAASARYAGLDRHPAPECFVCGPERAGGDGLRIFAGPLAAEAGTAAAPWVPDASLDIGGGLVGSEYVWAALDCPGFAAAAPDMRPMLLGELTAWLDRPVRVGERHVLVGWEIAASGRKHEAGTALFGPAGEICARARAVWIEPRGADGR